MKKEIKYFKKDNAGRSMTEMLGVLAIIGVLSLGGIIGYKLAMNRYAANQIAYEINMMKTDAKVKIMQGNDTLTLGQPYDGGTIRFRDYGTTFGCSFIKDADDESVVEEAATCQVANAYYIELKNIPEGICKPLANLIENMNDLIAFDINLTPSEEGREGGNCEEGENVLNAVFSAEPGDLEVLKCEKKEDCPDGLKCHNHLCVECTEDTDCGRTGHCENNACEYCESGVWDSATKQCVDCKEPSDCVNNPKGKICENKKCVECTGNDNCTNPFFPYCNQSAGKCEPCKTDDQCNTSQNEHCKVETGECITCKENEKWSDEFKECIIASCRTNEECNVNNKSGYYCYMRYGYDCSTEFSNADPDYIGGQCRRVKADLLNEQASNIGGADFYGSAQYMTWWSACRFCAAQTGGDESQCLNPANQPSFMGGWEDIDWQCYHDQDSPDISIGKGGYCKAEAGDTPSSGSVLYKNVSPIIQQFIKMYGGEWHYLWTRNYATDCNSWVVRLNSGQVLNRNRYYPDKAGGDNPFCRKIK